MVNTFDATIQSNWLSAIESIELRCISSTVDLMVNRFIKTKQNKKFEKNEY